MPFYLITWMRRVDCIPGYWWLGLIPTVMPFVFLRSVPVSCSSVRFRASSSWESLDHACSLLQRCVINGLYLRQCLSLSIVWVWNLWESQVEPVYFGWFQLNGGGMGGLMWLWLCTVEEVRVLVTSSRCQVFWSNHCCYLLCQWSLSY